MEDQDSIFSDIKATEVEASLEQRFLANFIDIIIEVIILVGIYLLLPNDVLSRAVNNPFIAYPAIFVLLFAYRVTSLLLYGKTIGMVLSRTKYLNKKLDPLSVKEKILGVFIGKAAGIKRYKIN